LKLNEKRGGLKLICKEVNKRVLVRPKWKKPHAHTGWAQAPADEYESKSSIVFNLPLVSP